MSIALPEAEIRKFPGYGTDVESSRAEARRLLAEAGVENLTIKLHNRISREPYTPVGVFVIDQWRRIGVKVEHSQVETAPFFSSLVEGKFDVAFLRRHPRRLTILRRPISTSRPTKNPHRALLATMTQSSTTWWDQQVAELDPVKRRDIVHEMERRMLEQNYYLSINWWQRIIVHHKKVKGWHFAPSHFQGQDLANVWLDN